MNADTHEKGTRVLIDVLERFAFELSDPADLADIIAPEGPAFQAEMTFDGMFAGRLTLLLPVELGIEIAANVLGLEPDDPMLDRGAADAIKEVLNVVCGNLLTELAGEEPVFDLSVPTASMVGPEAWEEMLGRSETVGVQIDDRPVLLQIQLEGAPS